MSDNKKSKGSKKARRSTARLAAVQTLYQMRAGEHKAKKAARDYLDYYEGMEIEGDSLLKPDRDLFTKIVSGVEDNYTDLYAVVRSALQKGNVDNEGTMDYILEATMVCGAFELIHNTEVDAPIIISDYLSVANAFYDKSEVGLVNAVLDRIAKDVR